MDNQHLVSPSRKCSSTPVGFFKDFLEKNNVATRQHPPHFSDMVAADSYLLSLPKLTSKGRCFCVATDIFKNATEELMMSS
jgi:hypothetical protein